MIQLPEEKLQISISEPSAVKKFLGSLGLQPSELELIAIEKGWQKGTPKKISVASLITITMGTGHLYKLCYARIYEETGRDLSLMKFSKYISRDLHRLQEICQWLQAGGSPEEHASQSLVKYCCYDKRKRLNYHQKQRLITAP